MAAGDRIPIEQSVPSADVGDFLNAVGPGPPGPRPRGRQRLRAGRLRGRLGQRGPDPRPDRRQRHAGPGPRGPRRPRSARSSPTWTRWPRRWPSATTPSTSCWSTSARSPATWPARNDSLNTLVTDFADVQDRLARLLRENRGDLDGTIDDLRIIADTLCPPRRRPRRRPGQPPRGRRAVPPDLVDRSVVRRAGDDRLPRQPDQLHVRGPVARVRGGRPPAAGRRPRRSTSSSPSPTREPRHEPGHRAHPLAAVPRPHVVLVHRAQPAGARRHHDHADRRRRGRGAGAQRRRLRRPLHGERPLRRRRRHRSRRRGPGGRGRRRQGRRRPPGGRPGRGRPRRSTRASSCRPTPRPPSRSRRCSAPSSCA